LRIDDFGLRIDFRSSADFDLKQVQTRNLQSGIDMSRISIIALLIFGAVLGYFLTFGPETTQKFKASVYQLLAPFLTGGSGIKKEITSVRTGLKSLDQLQHKHAALPEAKRALRASHHRPP